MSNNLRIGTSGIVTATMLFLASMTFANENAYRVAVQASTWVIVEDGSGAGVLVDVKKRLVLTNYHVVEGYNEAMVFFPVADGNGSLVNLKQEYVDNHLDQAIRGKVLTFDPRRDLALIELESLPSNLRAVKLSSKSVGPGETVHSIGNPGSSEALWVYDCGKVRQRYATETNIGHVLRATVIETDLQINPGDSGGPIVNDAGELVGLNSYFNSEAQGMSYGIDIAEIRSFLAEDTERDLDYWMTHGIEFLKEGDVRAAFTYFTKAIELDDECVDAYIGCTCAFYLNEEYESAIEYASDAIEIDSESALGYVLRGKCYWQLDKNTRAKRDLRKALELGTLEDEHAEQVEAILAEIDSEN